MCWFVGNAYTPQCPSSTGVSGTNCPPHDPEISYQNTAYNTVTAKVSYTYDAYNNRTQITESAYGNGAPGATVRTTTTSFTGTQYAANGSYSTYVAASINLVSLPLQQTVYNSTGATAAQTTWAYDGTSTSPCAGVVGHDNTNYGTTSTTPRGNPTTITRLWQAPVNNPNTTVYTNQTFDLAGNILSTLDSRGVRKDLVFADSGAYCALPISIIHYEALNPTKNLSCAVGTQGCLIEQFIYDYNILKPTSYRDFNNGQTLLTYADPLNMDRLTNVTRPDGGQTNYTYTDSPSATGCSTGTQSTSCFTVHSAQDLTSSNDGYIQSQTDYDGLGRKALTWYLEGPVNGTQAEIDTQYTYDAKNRPYTISNPGALSQLTTYTYDALDRPLTVKAQDNSVTTYVYTGDIPSLTNTKLEIEPPANSTTKGNNRLYFNDSLGRLVQVNENQTSWQGNTYGQSGIATLTTTYGYDALDDLQLVCQNGIINTSGVCTGSGNQSRTFAYDTLKHLVEATNPESGTIYYTYDASGNLFTREDARNITTCYGVFSGSTCSNNPDGYDGLNRLLSKTYNDGITSSVTYVYGDNLAAPPANCYTLGHLYSVTSAGWTYLYSCLDKLGRVSASSQNYGTAPNYNPSYGMSYLYNKAGKLTSFTFPSGRVQTNTYDTAARPYAVAGNDNSTSNTYSSNISWFPNGDLASLSLGPSLLTEQYCQSSRLQLIGTRLGPQGGGTTTNCSSSSDLLNLGFNYGASQYNSGNLIGESFNTPLNASQVFTYDAYDRLSQASETGTATWSQTYKYDVNGYANLSNGNRYISANTGSPSPIALPSFTPQSNSWFNSYNQLTNSALGIQYDSAGNLTVIGSYTFKYDAENRQYNATVGGTANTYAYDGEGRRVQKVAGGATTQYVYDAGGEVAAEYSSSAPPDAGTLYLTTDPLGTSRMVTTGTGFVIGYHDHLPFGEEIQAGIDGRSSFWGATDGVTHKFTGKERDAETAGSGMQGLDYFETRYLSSAQGRFTSPDKFPWWNLQHSEKDEEKKQFADYIGNPQNWNMYTYVLNNPLNHTDPTGMLGCQVGDQKYSTCTITVVYDPKTSKGTLTVTGQNKGDNNPTTLLTTGVVVGGDGHLTPTGTFTASVWEKDHVSKLYGSAADTPWSKTVLGGNAFGPYQLHIKELDSRGIFIHGTMGPGWSPTTWGNSIFLSPTSHGCVRMCNSENINLHKIMPDPRGNKIIIGTSPQE